MRVFDPSELRNLKKRSEEPENGQVTIIGGSDLFHGAPILALKTASRIVDMVFFSSPELSVGRVAENLKSQISSFIWVPWGEVDTYIAKSEAILIGPGMKRWQGKIPNSKTFDQAGTETKFTTERLLRLFPNKKWVIDAGALQVMDAKWIPQNSILTPNKKEFDMLFNTSTDKDIEERKQTITKSKKEDSNESKQDLVSQKSIEYKCTIVYKDKTSIVCSKGECVAVEGGNSGLTKGGTGDVLAGLTVALFAQNPALQAGAGASWIVKKAGDNLLSRVGTAYNADDLAEEIPKVLSKYL